MTGVTIDHMVSLIVLISVLLLSIGVYSQMIGAAIIYQRNRQVAMKATELIDSICLSTGYPPSWGQSNSTPLVFGLQQPGAGDYTLSPFSLQRLLPSGERVYYEKAGMWFINVSLSEGGSLLLPVVECLDYTTVTRLLGINGSYGFQLSITPTFRVSVSEVNTNPLKLKVEVRGPGLALSGATLKYHLYQANKTEGSEIPFIQQRSGTAQTDSTGSAILEFDPPIDGTQSAYSIIVYAHLSGLFGVGYNSRETVENNRIIPFVESFEQGRVLLAHSWDVHEFETPVSALHYNATFLLLTEDLELRPIEIANSTGLVNYGEGYPNVQVQIPPSEAGILLVTYRWGNRFGMTMMPWGTNALGVSITFGGDPSISSWVATELRQVTVNRISYQVKLAAWSLQGYQV